MHSQVSDFAHTELSADEQPTSQSRRHGTCLQGDSIERRASLRSEFKSVFPVRILRITFLPRLGRERSLDNY